MINKKNLWFLTLFSLILVLSVYYITMPSELLLSSNSLKNNKKLKTKVDISESEVITAMRVSSDEKVDKELDSLKQVLSDSKSSVEEKNKAFEKIKSINENRTKEKELESKIEQIHKLKSFVKIDDSVKVTINSNLHNTELANKIMRTVNEYLDSNINVTVEFKK